MKLISISATACVLSIIITGCMATYGLKETPLKQKSRHNYDALGISIDLPNQPSDCDAHYCQVISDSKEYQKNADCKANLFLFMYPMWFGHFFTEPEYCLTFCVSRLSEKAFEKFKKGDHYINMDICLGHESQAFQPLITEKKVTSIGGARTYQCLRKDIRLSNGDYIIARACLNMSLLEQNKVRIEITDVIGIINSICPLEYNDKRGE